MERQTVAKAQKSPLRVSHAQRQSAGPSAPVHPLLDLQRFVGNQAVQRLIRSRYIQTKLKVSTPGDPFEHEADRVADTVMRMPDSQARQGATISNRTQISRLDRKCTECEEEQQAMQRKPVEDYEPLEAQSNENGKEDVLNRTAGVGGDSQVSHGVQSQIDSLRGGGQPLPESTRAFFEPRFGHDFSGVRVHTGSQAAQVARSVNARAFTVGKDVGFGAGQYSPDSSSGRALLAHELTHTIQQRTAGEPFRLARVPCTSAAICSPPSGVVGSAQEFSATEEAAEVGPRDRRKRMPPGRAVAHGHAGRARQLEIFLNSQQPGRLANIQGIFIDQDLSPDTGAMTQDCAGWIAEALPAGAPVPPGMAGATKDCTIVPAQRNQEALAFNTTTNATIGRKPRELWRVQTLQTLIHETEHPRFETATVGRAAPAGVASPTCTRGSVAREISELAAILSEFPTVSRSASAEANPIGPVHAWMNTWFPFKAHTAGENIEGALKQMGCSCACAEVDAFVADTFNEVTTTGTWSVAEKSTFNARLRTELPPPGPPRWPL